MVTYIRRGATENGTWLTNGEWEASQQYYHPFRRRHVNLSIVAQHTIYAPYVAVCAGLHVIPSIPSIPGIEHVLSRKDTSHKPAAFHSLEYKLRSQLTGRKVMVLGTGETGMDLAYEAVKAGAQEVTLCSRSGYAISILNPLWFNTFRSAFYHFQKPW